jgi:iron complex outermembrane recepter protein
MSNRPLVGAVAFATSVCLCASLHAQPADVPTPGSSPTAPESSPAVPESAPTAPAPAAHQAAPASPDAAPTLPEINVTAKRAAPSAQPPKPGAPATHAAPTVRVARPANTARTRLVVSPRSPTTPSAAAPPAAPAQGSAGGLGNGVPPVVAKFQLPQESFSITAKEIEQTINLKDPEDAVKYMPSLFVRKRNDGDNQAVLATRTWGLNSSARSLIYLDDLLISALIGNNNSGAAPKWNLVPPEAIARVDFLDGPYAAAYPGNSIGGVLLITTKMPDKFEATLKETVSVQPWQQYGTHNTYSSNQTSMSVGDRYGDFAWLFSAY